MSDARGLLVTATHPIQYHAPVYRMLQERFSVPVTAIYGSDFSVAGYQDKEFGHTFAWDTDLLSGYTSLFLSRVADGGARDAETVSAAGLAKVLRVVDGRAVLLTGYSPSFHQKAFYHVWQRGLPMLFRGETSDVARARGPMKEWARAKTLGWLYGQCRRVLYVGQRSGEHFRRCGCLEDQLMFAPYCVDTTPFMCGEDGRDELRAAARLEIGAETDDLVVLFSGKLSARKGPDLLVRAIKRLDAAYRRRIVVAFLGAGSSADTLDELVRTEPVVRAHFVGFRNQRQLSPYYHAADLMALPSRHSETWGLVVNEALHHGLPVVVSTAVGCAPDLVAPGVTGEIAEADSVDSLAAALVRAVALVGRREIRERCRQRVSGFTVEKAAEGIARAYRSVVH